MTLKIKVKAEFEKETLKRFMAKLESQSFLRNFNQDVKNYMINSTKKKLLNSDFKGANTPLAPLTQKLRRSGRKPLVDRGNLMRSIVGRVDARVVEIGSNHVAARIHNRGGTIRPRTAQTLIIPADRMVKTKYGYGKVDLRTVLKRLERDGWSIGWHLRAIVGRRDGETKVLFIRSKKVDIPKRTFLWISPRDEKIIHKIFVKNVERAEV
jgi:phage gpG-like protein